jgi:hypothetical protein
VLLCEGGRDIGLGWVGKGREGVLGLGIGIWEEAGIMNGNGNDDTDWMDGWA